MRVVQSRKGVVVIGQGYVGLPLALEAAKAGWSVVGLEVDTNRSEKLSKGISTVENITDEYLIGMLQGGNYKVSNKYECLSTAEIVVVCVPTPLNENLEPDLSAIRGVVDEIVSRVQDEVLIINESTSYPGTLIQEFQEPILQKRPRSKIKLAVAPERVDPGNTQFNHSNTARIIGGTSELAVQEASKFYSTFCTNIKICPNPEIAETAKLLENSFRLVNIALINEFATICSKMNIDIWEVIDAARTKPFGFMEFRPGIGVGGHCIPIDPIYLNWQSKKSGVYSEIIELASQVNSDRTLYFVDKVSKLLPAGSEVCICGIGYKGGTRDIRESPSIRIIEELRKNGYVVKWFDPIVESVENEVSVKNITSDLLLIVHPYLSDSQISDFNGLVLDSTGRYRHLDSVKQV